MLLLEDTGKFQKTKQFLIMPFLTLLSFRMGGWRGENSSNLLHIKKQLGFESKLFLYLMDLLGDTTSVNDPLEVL